MRHKHHIIPRHLGGDDSSSNYAVLTPLEHAEAHWILWCTYRKKEDWLAAVGLEGWAKKTKILKKLLSVSGLNGDVAQRILHGDNYKALKTKASNAAAKARYEKAPIYTWTHPVHGDFTGKAVDLCRKYDGYFASHLNAVIAGERKQHKGWTKK